MNRQKRSRLSALGVALLVVLLTACATHPALVPQRTLTASKGVQILMADECGTGRTGNKYLISFNQLAIPVDSKLRWPVIFDFRKSGRTNDETTRGVAMLRNIGGMIQNACGRYKLSSDANRQEGRDYADLAIIAAMEAGLRLERATSADEFERALEEEDRRANELYLLANKWFKF